MRRDRPDIIVGAGRLEVGENIIMQFRKYKRICELSASVPALATRRWRSSPWWGRSSNRATAPRPDPVRRSIYQPEDLAADMLALK